MSGNGMNPGRGVVGPGAWEHWDRGDAMWSAWEYWDGGNAMWNVFGMKPGGCNTKPREM